MTQAIEEKMPFNNLFLTPKAQDGDFAHEGEPKEPQQRSNWQA